MYDCIVLGTGGIGSAALHHLARRGVNVLGIDRFRPGHDRGSSHGDTRVIRLAYMEHPDYVPLLFRAYDLWRSLEEDRGETLFVQTGLLQVGLAGGAVIQGVRKSAEEHRLEVDEVAPSDFGTSFGDRWADAGMVGLYEKRAGFLYVEKCVEAHVEEARRSGAHLVTGESVLSWSADHAGVTVRTDKSSYAAQKLVITAGPWASGLLADIGMSLEVRRKPLLWYASTNAAHRLENGMPTFLFETPEGIFYGFPQIDAAGVKIAEHMGGQVVDDPLDVRREVDASDREPVEAFARRYLQGITTDLEKSAVCMYTMSPDEHFVVDVHPEEPRVAFAAGLSGHGFKFAAVLGEALADLIERGETGLPIEFLSLERLARESDG